jgi:hypothetical protein
MSFDAIKVAMEASALWRCLEAPPRRRVKTVMPSRT